MASFETVAGVILALIAGILFTIGGVFQKKAVEKMPALKLSDRDTLWPLLRNKVWLIGVAAGLLGGIPYVFSQLLIGIGYTQLLIATGLILLAYMASRMLNEPLGIVEYSGIALIVIGSIFLGLAQLSPVNVTLSEPNFLTNAVLFFSPFLLASAAGLIFYKFSERGAAKNLAVVSGLIFGCGAGFSQIGVMGLGEGNWFAVIFGYFLLLVGTVLATLVVNIAFQKGKAIVIIPLQSSGNYLIPVLAGLLLFQQVFASVIWFIPALILIMSGVFLLSRIQAEMEKPSDVPDSEAETSSTNNT